MPIKTFKLKDYTRGNSGDTIINHVLFGFMKEIPLTHIRVTSTRGVQLTKNFLLLWFNHGWRVFKLGEEWRQVAYTPWWAGIIPIRNTVMPVTSCTPNPVGFPIPIITEYLGKLLPPNLACVVTALRSSMWPEPVSISYLRIQSNTLALKDEIINEDWHEDNLEQSSMNSMKTTMYFPTMVNWKLFLHSLQRFCLLILFIPANCTSCNLYSLNDNSWDNLGITYRALCPQK